MTQKVLVTGCTGLVGAAAAVALSRAGYDVIGVARQPVRNCSWSTIAIDLASSLAASELKHVPSISAIVHCAAVLPQTFGDSSSQRTFGTNSKIDRSLINFCRERGLRLIYCSGTSVYGQGSKSPINEDAPLAPSPGYVAEKVWAEESVSRELASYGILRICAPYGLGQRTRTVLRLFIERAMSGKDLLFHGTGSREQDFTHADDVARAAVAAVERNNVNGIFNVSGGHPISMRDLALLVSQVVGNGRVNVMSSGKPDPQEGYTARFDLSRIKCELGWSPCVSLKSGIVDWSQQITKAAHATCTHL